MTSPSHVHQLYYLHQVLGIRDLVWPEGHDLDVGSAEAAPLLEKTDERWRARWVDPCTLVVVGQAKQDGDIPFAGEQGQLLERMMQAMKIPWDQISCVEWRVGATVQAQALWSELGQKKPRAVLVLGDAKLLWKSPAPMAIGEVCTIENIYCLYSLDLFRLLAQPQEKKLVWEHLQKLMKALL